MPEIPVTDEDRIAVREVFCYALGHFNEASALELAAQAFRARHWGVSLREAWSTVARMLRTAEDPCGCDGAPAP